MGSIFPLAMVLLLGGFSVWGSELGSNTADVLYHKDGLISDFDWPSIYAKGDFNGDGYKDIVMKWSSYPNYWKALVIPGGPSLSNGVAKDKAVTTLSIDGINYPGFYSADLDNDTYDDMIITLTAFSGGQAHQRIEVYYGGRTLPTTINLGTHPDWEIVSQPISASIITPFHVAAGDVTGDGNTDLLFGSPVDSLGNGQVFLIPGTGSRRTGTFNASTEAGVIKFRGPAGTFLGESLLTGEFNNDGKRDMIFPLRSNPPGRGNVGMTYVIFGSSTLPPVWDFAYSTHAPNVAMWGDTVQFSPLLAEDVDGDGRDELYVERAYPDPLGSTLDINVLIPGTVLNSGVSVIDLRKSSPNFQPVVEAGQWSSLNNHHLDFGDFDGDGRADFVSTSSSSVLSFLRLSNDLPPFPTPTFSTASILVPNILGTGWDNSLGDVNGDGFDDLVIAEKGSTGTFWGLVLYGHHPLDNPEIHFRERGLTPTDRHLDFTVEGDPTEMRLDGEGDPLLMNRWLPFQPSLWLSLPPGTGTRTIDVTFRNRFGRVSERVQDSVTLGIEGTSTRPLTTVLRQGGAPIRIECQMPAPGRLKVWVLDRRGETIATLLDEERGVGLWPVDWEGRNSAGEPVAPGIFILYIETPTGLEKMPLVVQ